MSGNVWEWCGDWYEAKAYDRYRSGDLTVPANGGARISRGGAWSRASGAFFRCDYRDDLDSPSRRSAYRGFRCARDA